jgi:hypothetical protein
MARVFRLLVLIAVLLMPFGMAPAAAKMRSGAPAAGMGMTHCPEQGSSHRGVALGACTMACSAALPACDLSQPEPTHLTCRTVESALVPPLSGLHPEIVTPPPRSC